MNDQTLEGRTMTDMDARVRRLERQIRFLVCILVGSVSAVLALGSIAVTNAQPAVITANEVRAQRFIMLDPSGKVAAEWLTPNCYRPCY
jgi:hypothetical protein